MWPLVVILSILGLSTVYCEGEEEKVFRVVGTDSYLEAYKATRGDSANALLDDAVKKTDREFVEQGGYPYPNPQPQYGPPSYNYGPPRPQYGPPNPGPSYGPSGPDYGPPNPPPPAYGPPNPPPAYGPPNPPPVYGPPVSAPAYGPSTSSVQVFYGVPHAMFSFWDKLKLKLDLFTIGKILLKLVIFKKIVSFIAIICLLLFIPALKHKVESGGGGGGTYSDEEDMMRNLRKTEKSTYDEKLNNLAAYVTGAIESFSKTEGSRLNCETVYCRTEKILKKFNKKMTYQRLAKLYSKELRT